MWASQIVSGQGEGSALAVEGSGGNLARVEGTGSVLGEERGRVYVHRSFPTCGQSTWTT